MSSQAHPDRRPCAGGDARPEEGRAARVITAMIVLTIPTSGKSIIHPPSDASISKHEFIHHLPLFVYYQRALRAANFGTDLYNADDAMGDTRWGASLGHLGGDLGGNLGGDLGGDLEVILEALKRQ